MAYFSDLSIYSYSVSERQMLNVGWLARDHAFPQGDVAQGVIDSLLKLADQQQNVMRGVHDCDFCELESPIRMPAPVSRGYVSLGMGELHATDSRGRTYAAPSLVIHYIAAHRYRPPEEFLNALRCTTALGTVNLADD